ncbi:hypothetical protein J7J83_02210 [bacterium]|nr:hypothetical protein [bacterium]
MIKRNLLITLISCGIFIAFGTPTTLAVTFLADNELSSDEEILDDAYIAGGVITINNNIDGDLFVVGGQTTINGNINGDLVVAGGQITINGDVIDDARIGGGSIFVNGNIGDDLIATGGQLNVSSDSLIGGSLILGNRFSNILGTINEDIKGGGGRIILGGSVYGDVDVTVQDTIALTEKAKINGNFIYNGLRKAEFHEDQVEGFIEYNKIVKKQTDIGGNIKDFFYKAYFILKFIGYLSMVIIAFVLTMLFPKTLIKTADIAKSNPWRSMGLGLVIALSTIASVIVLGVTLIGLPLAGILLAVFLVTIYLAKIYAGIFIGRLLINPKKMTKGKLFGIGALGIFIIEIVSLVPLVGGLIAILTVFIGFGALWTYKKSLYKELNLQKI